MTNPKTLYVTPSVEVIHFEMESVTLIQSWGVEDDDLGSSSSQLSRLGWDPENEEEF